MKLSNPFVISGYRDPEYFCDRVTETERLCTIVRNEGHVTLLAPRRYGKTGLIHNAFARLRQDDGYETFYVADGGAGPALAPDVGHPPPAEAETAPRRRTGIT